MKRIRKPRWWATKSFDKRWPVREEEEGEDARTVFQDIIKGKDVYTLSVEKETERKRRAVELYRLDFSEFCIMKLEGSLLEEDE